MTFLNQFLSLLPSQIANYFWLCAGISVVAALFRVLRG